MHCSPPDTGLKAANDLAVVRHGESFSTELRKLLCQPFGRRNLSKPPTGKITSSKMKY